MAEVVNNGNDAAAVKPGDAAGSNTQAGFQSFAEFETHMARESNAGSSAATIQKDGGVRPASQIETDAKAAASAEEADAAPDEDETGELPPEETTPEQKAEAEAAAAKGPAKVSLKVRLGQLVREKHDLAQREAAALARAEAADERARLAEEAASKGDKPTARRAPDGKQPAPAAPSDRPRPEDFEFGEYDPNYQDAVVEWKVEQALSVRDAKLATLAEAEERSVAEAARSERWGGVIEKGVAKNTDFEAKVLSGKGWKLSKAVWELAVDSDVGHDVLYHLASDPAESSRIFDLPLTRQAAEFGKLEARFAQPLDDKSKSAAKDGAVGHMPKAPEPQSRVRGAGGQYKPAAGTKDFAQFEALIKAEEAAAAKARA